MNTLNDWLQPMDRAIRQSGRASSVWMQRHYDTTPEEVWDAWTNTDRLRRWLGEVTGELREGGQIVLDMGDEQPATCTILRCDPPRRLVVNWTYPGDGDTTVELMLSTEGERTLVQLEHVGFATTDSTRAYGEGWEDFLHCLGQHLRGVEKTGLRRPEIKAALGPFWVPLAQSPEADDRWPAVELAGEQATLAVLARYDAPPGEVWAAITEPGRLAGWFAQVELGDTWTATFPEGKAFGAIEVCEPARELVTSWRWDHETVTSAVRVTLEPDASGTIVRLVQSGAPATGASGYAAGWYAKLAGLRMHLDGAVVTEADWDADFALARRTV